MKWAAILAVSSNGVIGNKGRLPWHLPADLKEFKRRTLNHSIVMGRKTFDSIKKPLPERHNIVLTRDPNFSAAGIELANDWSALKMRLENSSEMGFIIGGAQIYEQTWSDIEVVYLTLIHQDFEGDAFFSRLAHLNQEFAEISRQDFQAEATRPAYSFIEYQRV